MLSSTSNTRQQFLLRCVVALAVLASFAGAPAPAALLAQTETCPCSFWTDLDTPAIPTIDEALPVELGMRFRASVDGYITAIRFYKGSANTGTHTGHLWAADGTLLGEALFAGETANGWQEATLSAPVPVAAGDTYIASYHTGGHWSLTSGYFASPVDRPPLYAPASTEASNGIYKYGASGSFPTETYGAANYWVDIVFDTTVGPDINPPRVIATSPINNATGVSIGASVTVRFNEAINESTLSAASFGLRDADGNLVVSAVSYSPTLRTATLDPLDPLATSTAYTVIVRGGSSGIHDVAGNPMTTDYAWSFVTALPPPDEGPGGPILVIASAVNPFTRYYAEILHTEGFNAFTVTEISNVTAQVLTGYDVVILGDVTLTGEQVTWLSDWVSAGGNLIAMRPDKRLAPLLGLSDAASTLADGYFAIDTTQLPGRGITADTMQFHGAADLYTLNGATASALLYSGSITPTTYPAVTLRDIGSNGGQAAMFAFDLARSVVYTRQGNPAWAGTNRDNNEPAAPRILAHDLFYGPAAADPQPSWVNFDKIQIPQADELQRLFANLILLMNRDKMPLPRFWYFPRGEPAVVIMTGDDHATGGTAGRYEHYKAISPPGCSVADWECIRASSYIWTNALMTDAQAASFTADGFEVGWHINTNCVDWASTGLDSMYTSQLASFRATYPSLIPQTTVRTHCVTWSDWASQAKIESANGIRLDTNYYYYPASWVQSRPGLFTGSGMPMRFADLDGALIDVYQAVTQWTDESGASYGYLDPNLVITLLDNAVGSKGYYGAFTANMHTDSALHAGSDTILTAAAERSVPVVSGRQMVEWLDGRNGSAFRSLSWNGHVLSFSITVASGARGLRAMLPADSTAGQFTALTHDGSPVAGVRQTIKGIDYVAFPAEAGTYQATYEPDTTAPAITGVTALPRAGGAANITWTTDEPSNSTVSYGTDPGSLNLSAEVAAPVIAHAITLTGLTAGATVYYRVASADVYGNVATYPAAGAPMQFDVPTASFIDTTVADFSAGLPDTDTYVASLAGGDLILKPAVATEFNGAALPAGWSIGQYPATGSGGTATVNNGILTLDGTRVGADALYGPGRTLEFVATFTAGLLQHVGFGIDYAGPPWAIFSTDTSGTVLQARSALGTTLLDTSLGVSWFGAPHRFRIDWQASNIVYWIDGNIVATHALAIANTMRPLAAEYAAGALSLRVDSLVMGPHSPSGTFLSRVFDAVGAADWGLVSWDSTLPTGASLNISLRTGDTPIPDGTWSSFVPAPGSGTAIGSSSRYIQYRADLATTDPAQSPILHSLMIGYRSSPDITPPSIVSRSPAPGATEIRLDSTIAVQFNEAMDPATLNPATLHLRAEGAATDVPALVSYAGTRAILQPTNPLNLATRYDVTLSGTAADVSGNLLGSDVTWRFTTGTSGAFADRTFADFSAGDPSLSAYIAHSADGEVMLAPTAGSEFAGATLPGDWLVAQYPPAGSNGTAVVANGVATLDGTRIGTNALFGPGRSLEFSATFAGGLFQHIGFGTDFNLAPWAIFSTDLAGTALQARTSAGGTPSDTTLPGNWFNTPHRFRIDWTATSVVYWIDGQLVATHLVALGADMRPLAAEHNTGGPVVSVDWLRLDPYAASGTFVSRVFDAGRDANWTALQAGIETPAGTAASIETRTRLTVDGAAWSPWQPAPAGVPASPAGRYFQYRVLLSTTDAARTPVVDSVVLTFSVNTAPPPPPPPPLPSRFYGAVRVLDMPPHAGDVIRASIAGVSEPFAVALMDDAGALHYIIEVPGDIEGTADKEGGAEGDSITFTLDSRILAVATWHSGTNVHLDFHPPAPALTAGSPAIAGSPITLDAGASADLGSDIATFAFDCNHDGIFEIGPQPGATAPCTFGAAGSHLVSVRVTDAQGGIGAATLDLTVDPAAQVLTLHPGWNLVSFALTPASAAITDVLAPLAGQFDLVYAWDATGQTWLKYDATALPYANSLNALDPAMGVWIHITTVEQPLTLLGNLPVSTEIGLRAGWNLVGYPSAITRALPGALAGIDFSLVYAYHAGDADVWKLYDRAAAPFSNDLTALSPGWGYWIKAGSPGAWVVPYHTP